MVEGLYIHIPICAKICTYCDFVKTARWSSELDEALLKALQKHLLFWKQRINLSSLKSINIGGGTPSLWTTQYQELFKNLQDLIHPDTEVTLEANPLHISKENLNIWRDCGFNRVSLGVQTFQEKGLKTLGRDHTPQQALKALELTLQNFPRTNIDLIYGWPHQTHEELQNDLSIAINQGTPHLSLYNLEYPSRTILGRQLQRGRLTATREQLLEQMYQTICSTLQNQGFQHHEVSNWAQPHDICQHNLLYWKNGYWVGIGPGAAGLLAPTAQQPYGTLYQYPSNIHGFLKSEPNFEDLEVENDRDQNSWLTEIVSRSLRTQYGVPLDHLLKKTHKQWSPTTSLQHALNKGDARITDGHLVFKEEQWLRETSWCLEVLESMNSL